MTRRTFRVAAISLLAAACLWRPAGAEEQPTAFSRAVAHYHDRNFDQAMRYAREAIREQPEHVDAHFLLGELYYLRQELTKALESLERAVKLAPNRKDIQEGLERVRQELKVEKDLARSDTHPFVVRFAEGQIPVDVSSLRQLLRDTHRLVGQQMGHFPDHSVTVILYPEKEFQQVRGVSHQAGGLYDGKIRLPARSGNLASAELERVLWHEYTHAVIHDLSKARCPLWLNEGIATLQEARVRAPDLSEARAAFRAGKLPAWSALWDAPYEQATLRRNYQVSYLIAKYLVERWSWKDLVGVLKRLAQGYPIGDALQAQYKEAPAVIEKEWLRWLRGQL